LIFKLQPSYLVLYKTYKFNQRGVIHRTLSAAKKFSRPSEDGSAGGGWGEECRAVRANTKRGQPRRLLVQSRTQQKSFLFLLEEKIGRAQNQKRRENFFAGLRVVASGGGAASFVGGFPKMRSDFVQGVEPNRIIRVLRLGASPLGGQIGKNFPRLFGFKANRLRAQNVVRRAKRGVNGNLQPILFLPPKAEREAIIFNCPKAI